MLNLIRNAVKNSLIYSLGNISIKLVGLILIPLYTNTDYLSMEDFGMLSILEITSQLLITIFGLALAQSLTRFFWDKSYKNNQKSLVFTVFGFQFVFLVTLYLVSLPFLDNISQILFKRKEFTFLLNLTIITSCIQVLNVNLQTLMKLQERAGLYSITNLVKLLINLVLTIYFVVQLKMKLEGIFLAQIIGGLSFLLFTSHYLFKNIRFRFNFTVIKEMLNYGYPLILASVSGILLSIIDRYTLNYLDGLTNVGIYSLAFRISNTIKILVITSIQMAISPMIFKLMGTKESNRFYSKYMSYSSFTVMFFVLGLSIFGWEIIKLFSTSTNYWEAYKIIPILAFSFLFGLLKDVSLTGLQIQKRTKIIGALITLIALLNLGLNVLLIPKYHIYGAAIATLISQIIFFMVIYIIAQRIYYISYDLKKVLIMILIGIGLFFLSTCFNPLHIIPRIVLKSCIILVFPFILYLLRFYEKIELQRIREFWKKWSNPSNWKKNLTRN